ncbi:MAG: ElyC/SanA/YdcF family protein [Verrucomicrobiota bacterium]
MTLKRLIYILFSLVGIVVVAAAVLVIGCNAWIVQTTKDRIFHTVEELNGIDWPNGDEKATGLVLGTSPKVDANTANQHFENRMVAAAAIIDAGKVDRLLLSGHRDSRYYDETRDMQQRLAELGVGEEQMLVDTGGDRTFLSIYRAKAEYDLEAAVIVSDDFHVGRALFLADRLGLPAIAITGEVVDPEESRGVRTREYFARVKAVLDLYWLELSGRKVTTAGLVEESD